jgi:hypothetical protein
LLALIDPGCAASAAAAADLQEFIEVKRQSKNFFGYYNHYFE